MTNLRILTKNYSTSSNSRLTGRNNNDLIIMPTGGGKTRGYVIPYLMNVDHESFIVTDTKASLFKMSEQMLRARGYEVMNIDFTDLSRCSCGYNPMDAISRREEKEPFNQADLMRLCKTLTPDEDDDEPFWSNAATMALTALMAYVMTFLPADEHNLRSVQKLALGMSDKTTQFLMNQAELDAPDCYAVRQYKSLMTCAPAEKMFSSIIGILAEDLNTLCYDSLLNLYEYPQRIHFEDLAKRKTAVFLTISDSDSSQDHLTACFYQQALQSLLRLADHNPQGRLPVPVRLVMDDFASYAGRATLPDFDRTISIIRSREVYVSVICQSLSQLEGAYGHAKAQTIINNCDQVLMMPGPDLETAEYISKKVNKTVYTILSSAIGKAYLFVRGQQPRYDDIVHPEDLPHYGECMASKSPYTVYSDDEQEALF